MLPDRGIRGNVLGKVMFQLNLKYELEVDMRKAPEGGEFQREGRTEEGTAWQLGKEVDLSNLYPGSLARC